MSNPELQAIVQELQNLASRISGVESLVRDAGFRTTRLGQPEVVADDTAQDVGTRMLAAMERAGYRIDFDHQERAAQPIDPFAPGIGMGTWVGAAPAQEPRQPAQQQPALSGIDDEHGPLIRRYTLPNGVTVIYHRNEHGLLGGYNLRVQLGNGETTLLVPQPKETP